MTACLSPAIGTEVAGKGDKINNFNETVDSFYFPPDDSCGISAYHLKENKESSFFNITDHGEPLGGTRTVRQDCRGDLADFWTCWASHREILFRLCLAYMSKNRTQAEDMLSEAMLRAAEKFPAQRRHIRNARAWLACLTRNVCLDHLRRAARQGRLIREAAHVRPGVWPDTDPAATATPEERAIWREAILDLDARIQLLPDHLRQPFALKCLNGHSYEEVASHLGLSHAAVRKRVQRARDDLRDARLP